MHFKTLFILSILAFSCNDNVMLGKIEKHNTPLTGISPLPDNPYPSINDIPLPSGFNRLSGDAFAEYLRHISLKKSKTVFKFNGLPKENQTAQFAVLDISVGDKDLQQCADAVMRLRAEYLFAAGEFSQIRFTDNEHHVYQFSPPYSKQNFSRYLQQVFGMCGSASLSKQLYPVASFTAIQPGDVIIRGGFPGHAVMVVDVAQNASGEKIYLLAQSYMPAQDIHVLVNPMDENLSPWYKVSNEKLIHTPEYLFNNEELKRW